MPTSEQLMQQQINSLQVQREEARDRIAALDDEQFASQLGRTMLLQAHRSRIRDEDAQYIGDLMTELLKTDCGVAPVGSPMAGSKERTIFDEEIVMEFIHRLVPIANERFGMSITSGEDS